MDTGESFTLQSISAICAVEPATVVAFVVPPAEAGEVGSTSPPLLLLRREVLKEKIHEYYVIHLPRFVGCVIAN